MNVRLIQKLKFSAFAANGERGGTGTHQGPIDHVIIVKYPPNIPFPDTCYGIGAEKRNGDLIITENEAQSLVCGMDVMW